MAFPIFSISNLKITLKNSLPFEEFWSSFLLCIGITGGGCFPMFFRETKPSESDLEDILLELTTNCCSQS